MLLSLYGPLNASCVKSNLIKFPMNQFSLYTLLCPDNDVTACFLQNTTHEPHAPGQISIYRPLYWQSRHRDAPIQSNGLFNLSLQWHSLGSPPKADALCLTSYWFKVIDVWDFLLFAWLWDCVMIPCVLGWNCRHRWRWHLVAPHVPQL